MVKSKNGKIIHDESMRKKAAQIEFFREEYTLTFKLPTRFLCPLLLYQHLILSFVLLF